jgi:hypothetical protein
LVQEAIFLFLLVIHLKSPESVVPLRFMVDRALVRHLPMVVMAERCKFEVVVLKVAMKAMLVVQWKFSAEVLTQEQVVSSGCHLDQAPDRVQVMFIWEVLMEEGRVLVETSKSPLVAQHSLLV